MLYKVPVTTASDNTLKYFFFLFFKENKSDITSELSAKQMVHMNCQDLFYIFSEKKKEKDRISSATNFAGHFKGEQSKEPLFVASNVP